MMIWQMPILMGPGQPVAKPMVATTFSSNGAPRSVFVFIDDRLADHEGQQLLEVYDLVPEASLQHLFTRGLQLRVRKNPNNGFHSFLLDGLSQ
jgi:hypothetical protein